MRYDPAIGHACGASKTTLPGTGNATGVASQKVMRRIRWMFAGSKEYATDPVPENEVVDADAPGHHLPVREARVNGVHAATHAQGPGLGVLLVLKIIAKVTMNETLLLLLANSPICVRYILLSYMTVR